ncbi:nuclease-related domain-containing protein [Psychrobacillus vulpis]|uniref:NERD domain-containing protein n=1 Tax=Psychrobacillus vulpis TaxID=2325572 RepID=A0A544TWE4_9BACI|nr:nuclease-related domain-containing protein [Psychrobacillus vulpis]TQR21767.1 NERD domain-containing protein [Psychrobacillus vulpis]
MNTEKPFENHYVLLKRIPDLHKKAESIRDNISRMEAGLRGETRLLQKLLELRLPCQFKIYSNVRLQMDDWRVQIDCLILTDRCCIVLESKNIYGDLYFDAESEDFYRQDENQLETSYPNPYYQFMKHLRFLKEWLRIDFPEIKLTGAVVMTPRFCRIRKKPAHYPIYKLESIIEKIIDMYSGYPSPLLSETKFHALDQMIIKKQSSFTFPPLCEFYQIAPKDLIPGVECPHCGLFGMIRFPRTWTCPNCKKNSMYAHVKTIHDYFLLIKNYISNREFREFCGVDSIYTASRMLKKMNLQSNRGGAWTYYSPKKDR